jgi:tRNA threonylcarbamoyladenosine biosynthesis protein TsaB
MSLPSGPILLLDASTPILHAGVFDVTGWKVLEKTEGDALQQLPAMLEKIVRANGTRNLAAFAYCEGPGAILGLRISAMLIRTLRTLPGLGLPIVSYRSLPMMAAILRQRGEAAGFSIFTPFRKGSHSLLADAAAATNLVGDDGLPRERLFCIPQRTTRALPEGARAVQYDLSSLPSLYACEPDLFTLGEQAVPFSPQPSEYKLWDGARHRG